MWPRNPGSTTPTSVSDCPLTRITEPIASGRPPNQRWNAAWLATITGAAPVTSSSGNSRRPPSAPTPSASKYAGLTANAVARSGPSSRSRFSGRKLKPYERSSVRACAAIAWTTGYGSVSVALSPSSCPNSI
jgi:hypothetical protein